MKNQPPSLDVGAVARGLTAGESFAVLAADETRNWEIPTHAGRKSNGDRRRVSLPTLTNLHRAGLILLHPPRLTELGLAVRAHLLATLPEKS